VASPPVSRASHPREGRGGRGSHCSTILQSTPVNRSDGGARHRLTGGEYQSAGGQWWSTTQAGVSRCRGELAAVPYAAAATPAAAAAAAPAAVTALKAASVPQLLAATCCCCC
jgi:hypothetical protein